jgi:hypothetical protein
MDETCLARPSLSTEILQKHVSIPQKERLKAKTQAFSIEKGKV